MFSTAFVFLSFFYVDDAIDYDDNNDVLSDVDDLDDDNDGIPDLGILRTILKINKCFTISEDDDKDDVGNPPCPPISSILVLIKYLAL